MLQATARSRPRRVVSALMLPREHGAWAILLMPYLLGTVVAGWRGWSSLLLLASLLLLFSSSRPLELTIQRRERAFLRLVLYLGLGGLSGALLLLYYQRWALVALGIAALTALATQPLLRRHRLDRSWPARLLSIAALSASGPAAYYTASGLLDRHAAAVWALAFLYSGASVFYVRLVIGHKTSEVALRSRNQLVIYLSAAIMVAVVIAVVGWLPTLGIVAFVPLVAKVAWALTRRDYHPSHKQVGFAEIGHTTLFALLAAVALATWG